MATTAYLGIDVGTQGVRAAVVAAGGDVLGRVSTALPATGRDDTGRHEQDPETWWTALVEAVAGAMAAAHGTASDVIVAAVALDATSGTVVVEAADGAPVGPALMYDDARATAQAARAAQVGAPYWDELGYRVQPTWALPKAMWLSEQDAVPVGGRIAHQSDHLVRRLVGGAPVATDTSNALKTGADTRTATWPVELLRTLGVAPTSLPELVVPGTELGHVDATTARATGLPHGVPVRAGMTDGCAAQIACGALAPGDWSSALGTTLVVKGSTAQPLHDPDGAVYCHRHPDGGWLPGGASSSGAGVIARDFPGRDLDALTAEAAQRVPVPGVTYPLAGIGERFPFVAPDARGFVTAAATDDPTHFASLCQAVAYVERLAYDRLAALGADVSGVVAFTGGATRNDWWNQLRVDVLGRTAVRPASSDAAVGMAVLAAAPPGELTATAADMVRIVERLEPDADRHATFDAGYRQFVDDLVDRGWLDRDLISPTAAQGGRSMSSAPRTRRESA